MYDQSASEEKASEIESELVHLMSLGKNLPLNFTERVDIFSAHVRTLLREHGIVNELLRDISNEPTAAIIVFFICILLVISLLSFYFFEQLAALAQRPCYQFADGVVFPAGALSGVRHLHQRGRFYADGGLHS